MPTIKEVITYKFSELPGEIQDKVVDRQYDINTDYDWFDTVYEDAKTIGGLMGIEIEKIYFSGFSSQGDGACFTGYYSHRKDSLKNVRAHAPLDLALHQIAKDLGEAQRRNFYSLVANVSHSGHYYHAGCTEIRVTDNRRSSYMETDSAEDISEPMRGFMNWIYKQLTSEYDYLTSREAIIETIEANEYDFTATGEIF